MLSRCRNNHSKSDYSEIEVCDRWQSFDAFLVDMGERPSADHSIDRIDPSGNYDPSNCRWATVAEQSRNKRTSRMVTNPTTGETLNMVDLAARLGVGKSTLHYRLAHWPLERVFSSATQ